MSPGMWGEIYKYPLSIFSQIFAYLFFGFGFGFGLIGYSFLQAGQKYIRYVDLFLKLR